MRRLLLLLPIWLVGACSLPFLPFGLDETSAAPEQASKTEGVADWGVGQDGAEALALTVASKEAEPVRDRALGSVSSRAEPLALLPDVPGGTNDVAAAGVVQIGPARPTQILLGDPAPTTHFQTSVPNTPPSLPPGGTTGGTPPTGGGGGSPAPTPFPSATFAQTLSSALTNLFKTLNPQ